jgi:hypothetical protein
VAGAQADLAITNNISVSATTAEPVPGNNSDSEDTLVTRGVLVANPAVTKSVDPSVA